MKHMKSTNFLAGVLICAAVLFAGCSERAAQLDQNWTSPVAVSSSIGGLGGAVRLRKYQGTVIGVQSLGNGSAKLLFWSRASNSWSQALLSAPNGYLWGYAAIDPQSNRILLPQGYAENEQFVMKAFIGTINDNRSLENMAEKEWITDKKTLLGETGPNIKLNFPPVRPDRPNRYGVGLGIGILNASEVYIPYCLGAITRSETNTFSHGPFNSGVFCSPDFGRTWQLEKISDWDAVAPTMCKTKRNFYYFAGIYPLWFSWKPAGTEKWAEPKAITKTFAMANGGFDVAGDGDTAHICWMDRRHNMWRFNIEGPSIENDDIVYCHRKDSDKDWSKEVLLSKGLLYSYAPSVSAEGDKVVVVWAGIRTADKHHTDMGPNDIYCTISNDGGKTWAEPLKVTDGAKDGITSGMPEVMLLNGVIHLFYIQGKREKPQPLSEGLSRGGQSPWPIYYTQRSFPD